MNSPRALAVFLALAGALAAVFFVWKDRSAAPAAEAPGHGEPGEGAPVLAGGGTAVKDPGILEKPADPGTGKEPEVGEGKDPNTAAGPDSGGPKLTPRERSLKRMEGIGRQWLGAFALEAAMPADQEASVWAIVAKFMKDFEALRWRKEVEEDVETTIRNMYEKAESEIRALLGPGQVDSFRGLPRDWGFGLSDPAPGQ